MILTINGDHNQEQNSEDDTGMFNMGSRKPPAKTRMPQNLRTRRRSNNKNGIVPNKSSSRKTPKPRSMTHQDPKGKGKQK
jgi:hypothetical protein